MNRENVIVIDLDDTMLNTRKMYDRLLVGKMSHFGITPEIFWWASNEEFRRRSGQGEYSFESHLEILREKIRVDNAMMEKIRSDLIKNISSYSGNYLFPDVADFLDSYRRQAKIIILTKGPNHLQSWKIKGLNNYIDMKNCFSKIIITQKDKGVAINDVCSEKNKLNVFIDDSLIQLDSVRKARPGIVTMYMKREIKRVNKERQTNIKNIDFDHQVSDLVEADEILSEMI